MSPLTKVKMPRLWRTRDPVELVMLGQLELPGFDIFWSRIESPVETNKARATSRKRRYRARLNTWPAARLIYQDDIN